MGLLMSRWLAPRLSVAEDQHDSTVYPDLEDPRSPMRGRSPYLRSRSKAAKAD